jgi:hypothetical protein
VNDDVPPPHITMTVVEGSPTDGGVTEGGTIQYLFERTGGDLNSAFDFEWAYNPPLPLGAATPGVDFVDPASHVITFDPGETQVVLEFETFDDGVTEGTEAFAITFVPEMTYTFAVVSNIAQINDPNAAAQDLFVV